METDHNVVLAQRHRKYPQNGKEVKIRDLEEWETKTSPDLVSEEKRGDGNPIQRPYLSKKY